MATIPSYDQWMKDTYSLTSPRSDFLKKVDEALKAYDAAKSEAAKNTLRTAFDRWRFEQSKQGKKWQESVRNSKGACTNLYRALNDLDRRRLSDEEREAMAQLSLLQAKALQEQFRGKQLRFKGTNLIGVAQGTGSKWERFKTTAKATITAARTGYKVDKAITKLANPAESSPDQGKIRAAVLDFCRNLCPDLNGDDVFRALNLGSVGQFASDLAPILGLVSSGGKAAIAWGQVAKAAYDRHAIKGSRFAIAPGDPEAAFDAVLVLLDQEIVSKTARAGVKTAAFTGKALCAAFDFGAASGPIIGLFEILAEIFQTIVEYVVDYRECKAGNLALEAGALDFKLFEICPILGCYFLCVQDHSTIINFAVADYGTPNFVFDAERLIAKIRPVLERARTYIVASRLEIPGMSHQKGIESEHGRVEKVVEAIGDKIDEWRGKPSRLPKVDKSRIVGYGHQTGGGFGWNGKPPG